MCTVRLGRVVRVSVQRAWLDEPGVQIFVEATGEYHLFKSWSEAYDWLRAQDLADLEGIPQGCGGEPAHGIIWSDATGVRQFVGFSHNLSV